LQAKAQTSPRRASATGLLASSAAAKRKTTDSQTAIFVYLSSRALNLYLPSWANASLLDGLMPSFCGQKRKLRRAAQARRGFSPLLPPPKEKQPIAKRLSLFI